jgi:hypothetical protein
MGFQGPVSPAIFTVKFLGVFIIVTIFNDIRASALWTMMDFNTDDHDVSPDFFSVENIPHQSNLTTTHGGRLEGWWIGGKLANLPAFWSLFFHYILVIGNW